MNGDDIKNGEAAEDTLDDSKEDWSHLDRGDLDSHMEIEKNEVLNYDGEKLKTELENCTEISKEKDTEITAREQVESSLIKSNIKLDLETTTTTFQYPVIGDLYQLSNNQVQAIAIEAEVEP